ncbi:MAG: T9SS type A sorting domain-containing protein [Ignavibacteriaceae bacterium]|nr:T9SS type A sorting domain-containing protein [Ignavibacteriaceae bacterium]
MNNKSVLQIIQKIFCARVFVLLQLLILSNGILQAQWVNVNVPFTGGAYCLMPVGTNIFAGTYGAGIYLSTDNGTSWTAKNTGLTDKSLYINCLGVHGQKLYAGTEGYSLCFTTNNGGSWSIIWDIGIDYHNGVYIYSIIFSGSLSYIGLNYGIVLSTDSGNNWGSMNQTIGMGKVNSIVDNGTKTFFGTDSGLCISTDNGFNWTNIGLTNNPILTLFKNGSNIYAGTASQGIFLSTNDGSNWTTLNAGLPGNSIHNFIAYDSSIFVATSNGIYRLDNSNSNWTPVKSGLTDTLVYSLAVCGTYLFAGTSRGLWKRPLSELVGISPERIELPKKFLLLQNYPNPFNPSTLISYSLPSAFNIKLIIYNSLGQTVKVLENGFKNAGNYSVNFNAADLPSGIYFYKLEAGQFAQVKKMMVIK